ncbi:peroxiredoxin-like family protein [Shewanella livingstonensis]|uniref:thioredoxin-dependent peroxiredoxin n=1 Tax=Shewanella livingstonensis TaxID=150120 RepID=A0A3G8M190_9GAMM|nr:peroxiredoxin-like family protein [Shewanella livingstonensis]AZG74840.1 AhpC/TSA family protein [Shewanella livingstonensis]
MALTEKLNEFKKGFTENVPQDIQGLMQQATQNLADSGIVLNTPKKGDKLAEFSLINAQGTDVSLSSLLENGPVVVTFYRGGWCPYCNLALREYQASLEEIKALGATLVAITPELADASLSTTEKNELQFEVLTDTNAQYAKDLGLVFTLPEELRPVYLSFGIAVEEHNGANQFDLPLAATFVVAQDGTIASAFVEVDYTLRQEPSEVIKVLKSL